MVLVRLLGFLFLIVIGLCLILFLFTQDRRYLKWGWQVFRLGVIFAMIFAAFYVLERIIMII